MAKTQVSRTYCLGGSLFLLLVVLITAASGLAQDSASHGQTSRSTLALAGLKAPVEVYRDIYGIPHIYARSAEDAYFTLGYVHATDRLFEMEIFRRRASGTMAEIFGKALLNDDIFMRQLGIRRTAQEVWDGPDIDAKVRREILAYCAGVNARLHQLAGHELPEPFRTLGLTPAPWTPVDALVFPKYMGWDQSGTDTDVWMGMLVEKLGLATVEELFPLDRPYEIPTISEEDWQAVSGGVRANAEAAAGVSPGFAGERRGTSGGIPAKAGIQRPVFPPGFEAAALELHRRFVAGRFGSPLAFGSNNWVVDGKKSATGKPLLANDPHLGLSLPSIWYTAHVVAPGLNVTGVTFAGFPYAVIGHNDHVAWGFTNLQSDAVDYFIEKMDDQHPHQYFHRGAWHNTVRRVEEIPVRGEPPVRLEIESTVHGPLVTDHGVRLALDWTGLAATPDANALAGFNKARNLREFRDALRDFRVPPLNIVYADVDGNIAMFPHGALPIRKRGDGRWPVDGSSGDYDWAGTIPDDKLPAAINPPEHFLASANGRPTAVGYPFYLGWMWDPSYRTRRIHELLRTHNRITVAQMEAFQMDAHDSAAESFVPVLTGAYDRKPFGDETVRHAIEELRRWDFVATPESVATTIWSAWFQRFRDEVWEDDFAKAGVEHWSGGWGFAGENERQPELEILEYLTREIPASPWFDDVRTPERETRDDILARSFVQAIQQLVKDRGPDVAAWKWGKTNVLRLHSLTRQPALDRGGMPVRGDDYTLCPGGNGGAVTGGASWRMVVDLANPTGSFGVYPGGESENPASPHYDDQTQSWAEGKYLPLYFYSSPKEFRPGQVESVLILTPR
jgi:penicillin amidase